MAAWIDIVLFNAASAILLALGAWIASRRLRRPALAHTLLLLVLLKLVAPPLVPIARVPRVAGIGTFLAHDAGSPTTAVPIAGIALAPTPGTPALRAPGLDTTTPGDASVARSPGTSSPPRVRAAPAKGGVGIVSQWLRARGVAVAALTAATGALLVIGLTLVRARRFRRLLRHAPLAPEEIQVRGVELARTLEVRSLPKIRLVPQHIPPSLWPRLRGCEILLPAALLPRLSADERDLLIAHELAHVRRRDHWLRPVEQTIVALYWWHPVAWWARRQLRAEEEKSCDAMVVAKLPQLARVYAEAVLKTLDFLAMQRSPAPAFATGAGGIMRLEERMKTILSAKASQPASLRLRLWLLLPAVVAVLVAPAWVDNAGGVDTTTSGQVSQSVQLHREELRLQKELHQLEARRQQIQMQIETILVQRQQAEMRAELQRLEHAGATEEAAELRRQLTQAAAEAELRREQLQSESAYVQKRQALEFELQDLSLQRDEAMAHGDEAKAKELHARAEEIAKQIKALELDAMRGEIERSRKQLEQTQRELEGLSKP